MPVHLTSISSTFFTNLLNRLGCKPPPPDGFDLINIVQPVSIVDADISIPAVATPQLIDTVFTQGNQVNPPAGTLLADTGPQVAGNYNVYVQCGVDLGTQATLGWVLARRNAANNADIWSMNFQTGSAGSAPSLLPFQLRVVLQANERIVIRSGVAAPGAGVNVLGNLWLST